MNTQEDDSLLYRSTGGRGKLFWYIGIGLFVAWNILLFILAVVAIAKVNNQSTSSGTSYTYAPITRSFTTGPNEQIPSSVAVSLLPSGNLRRGGGTSVYLTRGGSNLPNIPATATGLVVTTFNIPPSGGFSLLSNNELAFLAYTDNNEAFGCLGVLSLNPSSLTVWSAPQKIAGLMTTEALIPLRVQSGTGVKKTFVLAGAGKIVVGTVTDENPNALSFTTSQAEAYPGTSNTLLARLSNNAFALAYFTIITVPTKQHKMQASVGNVTYDADGNFKSLTLSAAFDYTADRPYHAMFPLTSLTNPSNEFVLAYPSSSAILINSTTAPDDTLVILKGKWNGETLTFGPSTTLNGVRPNVMMTAVGMPTTATNSAEKGVIFFINEKENNALTAVSVTKDPGTFKKLDSLAFGATLKISDDAADSTFQFNNNMVVPFVSATYIDEVRVGLAFSDLADLGRISTMVLNLSPYTLELTKASAKFVISDPNPNYLENYYWVVTAPLKFNSQTGFAVWQYLQTNVPATKVFKQSIVEIAPPPLGVVPDNARTGTSMPVVVSGVYRFSSGSPPFTSTVGRYYYTDTMGQLHARNGTDASLDYVISDNVLLSLNSRVGVAVSASELLLISQVNN